MSTPTGQLFIPRLEEKNKHKKTRDFVSGKGLRKHKVPARLGSGSRVYDL